MAVPLHGTNPILQTTPWSHTLPVHISQYAFLGPSSQPLHSLIFAKHPGPIPSLSDLLGAADSANHFPSSLSSLLLASLTEKKKKILCKINIDHKGYVFLPFFTSHFSISIGSICCNYNSLQLNVRGRHGVGEGNIDRMHIKNIEVFNIKIDHPIISHRRTAAPNSTVPSGKIEYRLASNTCPLNLMELSLQGSLWLFSLKGETQARVCGSLSQQHQYVQGWGVWCLASQEFAIFMALWGDHVDSTLTPAAFPPRWISVTMLQK